MLWRRSLLAVLLLWSAAFPALADGLRGPRIYVPEPRHDIGTVKEGDLPEYSFEIRNVGSETLVISGVKPS